MSPLGPGVGEVDSGSHTVSGCQCEHVSLGVCAGPVPIWVAPDLCFGVSRFLRACGYVVCVYLDLVASV